MVEPKQWTLAELTKDAEAAKTLFRRRRLDEPLQLYSAFFETFKRVFGELIDQLPALGNDPVAPNAIAGVVHDSDSLRLAEPSGCSTFAGTRDLLSRPTASRTEIPSHSSQWRAARRLAHLGNRYNRCDHS